MLYRYRCSKLQAQNYKLQSQSISRVKEYVWDDELHMNEAKEMDEDDVTCGETSSWLVS